MITVISETGGQTCNKFWQYLFYLKDAIISGNKVYVQIPDKTIEEYPNLLNSHHICFPFYFSKLTKKIGLKRSLEMTRKFTICCLNNYVRCLLHNLSFGQLNFVSGKPTWGLKNVSYKEILPILRELFDLRSDLKKPIDTIIPTYSDNSPIYCGVHMRGGDYRTWLGGKYFFTQQQYRQYMDKFLSFFPDKKIVFYIASNEPIETEVFEGLDWVNFENASATQDLYALSKCNYIIGVLSSFNSWVSLVWEIPLFTIININDLEKLTIDDFGIVQNYYRKDNGWTYPRKDEWFLRKAHPWLYRHSNREHQLLQSLE